MADNGRETTPGFAQQRRPETTLLFSKGGENTSKSAMRWHKQSPTIWDTFQHELILAPEQNQVGLLELLSLNVYCVLNEKQKQTIIIKNYYYYINNWNKAFNFAVIILTTVDGRQTTKLPNLWNPKQTSIAKAPSDWKTQGSSERNCTLAHTHTHTQRHPPTHTHRHPPTLA